MMIACLGLLLSACSSPCGKNKDEFVKNYKEFIASVQAKKLSVNAPEWKEPDSQLRKFVKECYPKFEAQLDITEKARFWINATYYIYARYGKSAFTDISKAPELVKTVKEQFKTVKEQLDKLGENVEGISNDLQGAWGDVENLLKDLLN